MWNELESILKPYKRSAWMPQTVENSASCDSSKFSGIPILLASEDWPVCQNCKQSMQLFLQLNANDLPPQAGKPFGDGYLQVFYCTNWEKECEMECDAFLPFAKSTLVRVLDADITPKRSIKRSPVKNQFPEKEIIGWTVKEDYPDREELETVGYTLTDEQVDLLRERYYPLPQDKLLGWPFWIQGIEYPDCPQCGQKMVLVFQIDSEDNLPYMFGDMGCSYITQCKTHQDQITIAWACG